MKKTASLFLTALMLLCILSFAGCSSSGDPGTPPENVINPGNSESGNSTNNSDQSDDGANYDGKTLENAVSICIGRDSREDLSVDMINNAAVNTMLDYLSSSTTLFPTYTYSDEDGFVGQNIRGNYTRDDETTIADIKAGELYLFSDGQLRLYFKDVNSANITATPVGHVADADGITEAVQTAYESNIGDTWGVSVYFQITKNI